jgi:hypothetical protein
MCPATAPGSWDSALQQRMGNYLARITSAVTPGSGIAPTVSGGEAQDAATTALGAQHVSLWLDHARHGWTVAFSPGAQDATTTRAAIRSYLAARLPASEVDYLDRTLTLLPTPYTLAQLHPIVTAMLPSVLDQNGILSGVSVGCELSDGFRVELSVIPQETPEVRAQVEAFIAPYGDLVRVRFGVPRPEPSKPLIGYLPELPPAPLPAKVAPRLRDHVSLPATARCVRGGTLKVKPGKDVERLKLAAGSRRVFARDGRAAKLKLKARRTKVAVTVTLKGGGTASQTFTYRRCA